MVGDWFEECVAFKLLAEAADQLGLELRSRFKEGNTAKIIWKDLDGNGVDYDFVMLLPGTEIPVAFYETFWRRGTRHSKDKARDDSTKLRPMRDAYPTARTLGILASGDFSPPARDFIESLGIELFYVTKEDVIAAWNAEGLGIDYPDRSSEEQKAAVLRAIEDRLAYDWDLRYRIGDHLLTIVGPAAFQGLKARIVGRLSSLPRRVTLYIQKKSHPLIFDDFLAAGAQILDHDPPGWPGSDQDSTYIYQVLFDNGDESTQEGLSWAEVQELHRKLQNLVEHMTVLAKRAADMETRG
jgi:hypothetical protein